MKIMRMATMIRLLVAFVAFAAVVSGQQSYVNNKQLDCYNAYNTTDGYLCNGAVPSCTTYLTFRSISPYNSPATIAFLLKAETSDIAAANNITDVAIIPADTPVLVPVSCSCAGQYSQHNASYSLKSETDTYFGVANNTYQGLTTCQSLMAQNPYGDRNLTVGQVLNVPVRCACPTVNQTAAGIKYLVAYLVITGDDPSLIAERFGVDLATLLEANELSTGDTIYPYTPLLVPLKTQPTPLQLQELPTAPSPSPPPPPPTSSSAGGSSNKWVFIGVGIGAASLALLIVLAVFLYLSKRRRQRQRSHSPPPKLHPGKKSSTDFTPNSNSSLLATSTGTTNSWSAISSGGLKGAVESLTVYKFEELQRATQFFSESARINGSSVFKGSFDGDYAAVKVVVGDVSLSGDEINIMKRINHSNIVRLSGFCAHQGNTYLVYEFAPSGSLADCLRGSTILSWKQRVQIAHDVASALNYLHNFTSPPYIHKNLNTSNILLDANHRAKVANFGLARAVKLEDLDQLQQTRHVVGTRGYMPPEYIEDGVISPKLDVFAFGVVLLELLSGRRASGDDEYKLLWESISNVLEGDGVRDKIEAFMDPSLKKEYPLELAFSVAQLAKSCAAAQINSRPTMAQVFGTMSKILSSTLDWDPSDADDLRHSLRSQSPGR